MPSGQAIPLKSGVLRNVFKSPLYFSFSSGYICNYVFSTQESVCPVYHDTLFIRLIYVFFWVFVESRERNSQPRLISVTQTGVEEFFFMLLSVAWCPGGLKHLSRLQREREKVRVVSVSAGSEYTHRERKEVWGQTCLFLSPGPLDSFSLCIKFIVITFSRRHAALRELA